MIIQASSKDDAVAAVRLARAEGLKIGVRSGGHSWSGSHLRDGILLLDVSALTDVSINTQAMTATALLGDGGPDGIDLPFKGDSFGLACCSPIGCPLRLLPVAWEEEHTLCPSSASFGLA